MEVGQLAKSGIHLLTKEQPKQAIDQVDYLVNIVAVDFDDTLSKGVFDKDVEKCTYSFNKEALSVLIEFQQRGGKVIIWTCREGAYKAHALKALRQEGFYPDYVNEDTGEIKDAFGDKDCHKVYADLYIDDRNSIDRTIDWQQIAEWLRTPKDREQLSPQAEEEHKILATNAKNVLNLCERMNGVKIDQIPKADANETMQDRARRFVMEYFNEHRNASDSKPITYEETYLVWFCKTLQNWKALVGTTVSDGAYYEVAHNGDKEETYLDVYKQVGNICIPDEINHVRKVVYVLIPNKGKSKLAKQNGLMVFENRSTALSKQLALLNQGIESTLQVVCVE